MNMLRRRSRSNSQVSPGFASFQSQLKQATTAEQMLSAMDQLHAVLGTIDVTDRIAFYKSELETAVEVRRPHMAPLAHILRRPTLCDCPPGNKR
jgi:hypothetical protein